MNRACHGLPDWQTLPRGINRLTILVGGRRLSEAFPQKVWVNRTPTTSITAQVTP
jgi:hypothetical protein